MSSTSSWPSPKLNSADEFNQFMDRFSRDDKYLFRGQGDETWFLEPSIDRKKTGESHFDERLADEKQLIKRFRESTLRLLPPHEQILLKGDSIAAMTVMQHYGAPTRLLDWTRSIAVAAFFASISEHNTDGSIWWIEEKGLWLKWKDYGFSKAEGIDYCERVFDADAPEFVGAVHLSLPFSRPAAQRGLFLIGGRLGRLHDQVLKAQLDRSKHQYGRIIIPAGLKLEILNRLERLGIDAVSLRYNGADRCGLRIAWERGLDKI